jgi:hypothetical protein
LCDGLALYLQHEQLSSRAAKSIHPYRVSRFVNATSEVLMRVLARLKRRNMEKAARSWGKWCSQAMLFGFFSMEEYYKGGASPAVLAGKALLTRAHWSQVGETGFHFQKSGRMIHISDDTTLQQLIHMIIDVEYGHALIRRGLPPEERNSFLKLAHVEADKFVTRTSLLHSLPASS